MFRPALLCLLLILCLSHVSTHAQSCPALPIHETASIGKVQDGDTLHLKDGRRIRLIAINTPELSQELSKENQPAQALAESAKQAAINFLNDTNTVHLHYSERKQDRYGRILAHVFHPQRGSLEAHLVSMGLAFPLAIPPDFLLSECLTEFADEARRNKRGVWDNNYWAPIPATQIAKQLLQTERQFRRVCGSVEKIDKEGELWIELKGDVVIRINNDDQEYFIDSKFDLESTDHWINKNIEFWTWLHNRSDQKSLIERGFKPWVAQVRSPHVIRWASSCD